MALEDTDNIDQILKEKWSRHELLRGMVQPVEDSLKAN